MSPCQAENKKIQSKSSWIHRFGANFQAGFVGIIICLQLISNPTLITTMINVAWVQIRQHLIPLFAVWRDFWPQIMRLTTQQWHCTLQRLKAVSRPKYVVEKALAKAVVTKQAQPANSASQICKTLTSLIGHFFVRNYSVKYNIGIFCEAA